MREDIDPKTGDKWIILNSEELRIGFLSQCIEALAEIEKTDYLEMFQRLERADMTEGYILKYYDVLHTQSWEHIISDIQATLKKRENRIEL